jgi:FMN phosphatase YigB (HAD superfamily)
MQRSQAVVFDLGKVLLDFDYPRAVQNLVEHCAMSRDELLHLLQGPNLLRYESGGFTSLEFFEEIRLASRFCQDFGTFETIFGDIFTPIDSMVQFHEQLRTRGVQTYIFSNTNEIAVNHLLRTYPFLRTFDGHIFSYEHRAMKPDPAIYRVVEKESRRAGSSLIYIDDRKENVEQGEAFGWKTIHHRDPVETIARATELLS